MVCTAHSNLEKIHLLHRHPRLRRSSDFTILTSTLPPVPQVSPQGSTLSTKLPHAAQHPRPGCVRCQSPFPALEAAQRSSSPAGSTEEKQLRADKTLHKTEGSWNTQPCCVTCTSPWEACICNTTAKNTTKADCTLDPGEMLVETISAHQQQQPSGDSLSCLLALNHSAEKLLAFPPLPYSYHGSTADASASLFVLTLWLHEL